VYPLQSPGVGEPEVVEDANLGLAAAEGGYNPPSVEADQDAIAAQVFARLIERVAGWQPHDGNLDTWLIEAFSEIGAEIRSLAGDVPASIFGTYGTRVLNLPPYAAAAATGKATFTAQDSLGYTLDPGATFALARSGNDLVAFTTLQEATVPVGSTEVHEVPFVAVELGAAGNGLSGEGQMLDPITWVAKVNVPVATGQGADAEEPEAYVDRLANLFPAVGLRPILPMDFAVLAMQLVPGVGRAVVMNLYDPTAKTWNNARTVTLVVTDEHGELLSTAIKEEVVKLLEGLREVNWVIHVIDPTYATITATATVVAFAGQSTKQVEAACIAALKEALSPANYLLGEMSPASEGGEVINPPAKEGATARNQTIYQNELIALLDRTLGVDRVASVTIGGTYAARLSATLSTASAITSLPITGLANTIPSGASIALSEGTHTQTFSVTAQVAPGAASIPVASATPNFAYTPSATISGPVLGDWVLATPTTLPKPGAITVTVEGGTP
jgi:hypothetical protein